MLPIQRRSEYIRAGAEGKSLFLRLRLLGRKTVDELDELVRAAEPSINQAPPRTLVSNSAELRTAICKLFSHVTVQEALARNEIPARFMRVLTEAGYAEVRLSDLLSVFREVAPGFLRLPNVGRRTVRDGRLVLGEILCSELEARGWPSDVARNAEFLVLDG